MAENTPNKKDIQDAQSALDQYNDALKESVDLAKIISNNIALLAGGMNRVGKQGRTIVSDLKEYSKELGKTINLSDKLAAGKLKEKEVTDQIGKLQAAANKYLEDASKRNSLINQNKRAQKRLEEEIAERLKTQNALTDEAEVLFNKQAKQVKDLEASLKRRANAERTSNTAIIAEEKIKSKLIESQLKATTYQITEQQRLLNNEDKIIAAKKQELEKVEAINQSHKDLKKQIEKEKKDNEIILQQLKEQNSLAGTYKKLYEDISGKISDTLKPMSLISAAFDFLKKTAFAVSDQTTQLEKNLVLSNDEAYDLRQNFNLVAAASGDAAINTARLVEANIALGKELGFNSKFTTDLNTQFVKLTKQIGLSEEAAGGLAKLSIATGSTLEESKNIALGTSQALSSQYGIQLNQREVLEEIGKVSGQTLAMLKASPQAIAAAVAQAKLLGTNLDTVRKQAASLLDFETSIENELQAELLTGQQLNLERARTAALTGDLTTAMEELNSQNIDFNKFSNMNVIAQDKVAAALGLSSDELSDQLLKQQYMNKSREEVVALAGEEVAKRLEALNAQDKFNLAIEKLQDALGTVLAGPLGTFVDMMASLASSSAFVYGTLTAIAGVSLARTISSLVAMSASLAGSAIAGTTLASVLSFGTVALVALGSIAAIVGAMNAATAEAESNAQQVGDMFSSRGKTVVSPKEGGLFELSDNDEFAAAPGLGDMLNNTNRQTIIAQDNSALLDELRALRDEMKGTKEGINKLNSKEGVVRINGQAAGTAQMMGNYNLA